MIQGGWNADPATLSVAETSNYANALPAASLDPTGAMAGLSLISTLFGAFSQHQAGAVNKKLQEYNAQVAEARARDAIARGVVAEERRRTETKQIIGAQRSVIAHGRTQVDLEDSSAIDVQANAAYIGELDALTIRNNAALEAWSYRVQGADYRLRGQYAGMTGTNQAAATLLTGASNLMLAKYGFGRSPLATDPTIGVR